MIFLINFSRIILFALIFVGTYIQAGQLEAEKAGMSQERLERIAPALSKYVASGQLPGLITAVARKGEMVHFEVQGFSDVKNSLPLKRDSLFRIYSMSKPITGVALMILIEEGKIRLSDPVALYIPEFAGMKVLVVNSDGTTSLESQSRRMTIRDLATHTSGVAYNFTANKELAAIYNENKMSPYFSIDDPDSLGELLLQGEGMDTDNLKEFDDICDFSQSLATKTPLMHQPGSQYTYGMSMDVLGCVIERVSGKTFDVFLKERIFDPLEMRDTFFSVPNDKANRLTDLYAFAPALGYLIPSIAGKLKTQNPIILIDKKETSPYLAQATVFDGGSGLVSSTQDYLRFSQMLLNGGKFGDERILSRKSVELLSSNHLSEEVRAKINFPGMQGFGITVGVDLDKGLSGTHGSAGTFYWGGAASTIFWVDPKEDLIAVLMTQVLASPLPLREEFGSLVYQAIDD
jgi:CubicO group peptidase (beta-lactamase class C family)